MDDKDIEELFFGDDLEDSIDSEELIDENPIEAPSDNYQSSFNNINFFKNTTSDSATSDKLRSIGNQNRSFPLMGASFGNEESITEQNENSTTQNSQSSFSKGIINNLSSKENSEIAGEITSLFTKKYKKQIIIISCVIACVFLLLIVIIGVASNDEEIGRDTNNYVTGATNEDGSLVMDESDLIGELKYYGYCDDEDSCKSKGIYRFLTELKTYYNDYKQECPTNVELNEPCGIELNTGLIIETMNYYQNSSEQFDTYNDPSASNADKEEGFNIFDFFSNLVNKFKKQQAINQMIDDVEGLTLAQAEYVEETCQYLTEEEKTKDLKDGKVNNKEDKYKKYYYQISYDKYISYLKYGDTSTHPNYSNEPLKKQNEICEYNNG